MNQQRGVTMDKRQVRRIAIGATVVAAFLVTMSTIGAQSAPVASGDFSAATTAEVRNAQGQVVLSGKFAVNDEDDDDVERKARLAPTAVDADAAGEAEVEVDKTGNPRRQEVEFELSNLQPGAVFTLLIDGKVVATVTADGKGRATHEREIPMSGTGS
jgi:hypothetical protein